MTLFQVVKIESPVKVNKDALRMRLEELSQHKIWSSGKRLGEMLKNTREGLTLGWELGLEKEKPFYENLVDRDLL